MPPMTGRVIAGRYSLQSPIGRGAMGVVWRARDQLLDREVAVKEVVISELIGQDERRNAYQRTLREARTAARLSHRGVVAVYDVAEEDGRPWIIMELVPSQSLEQVLSVQRRLSPLRAGHIGKQLLAALAHAHACGVLHRDVKPSNVLIARDRTGGPDGWDERAVLTDFGIAQFQGDPRLTQTGMVMGSPGFTAPERIRGAGATPASDLWSLGATIYTAVEGRGPYERRGGAITTMSAIIHEDAPIAAHAGELGPLIAALLRRNPSDRPSASAATRMFAQVVPRLTEMAAPRAATIPATIRSASPSPQQADSAVSGEAAVASSAGPLDTVPTDADATAESPDSETTRPMDADDVPSGADAVASPGATRDDAATVPAQDAEAAQGTEAEDSEDSEAAGNTPGAGEPGEPAGITDASDDGEASDAADRADAGEAEDVGDVTALAANPPSAEPPGAVTADGDSRAEAGHSPVTPVDATPTELSSLVAAEQPKPTFTASRPGERVVPTFSTARSGQRGATPGQQRAGAVPAKGSAQPGSRSDASAWPASPTVQHAGPSQPRTDLSQYRPGTGGGRDQRRGATRWIFATVITIVLVAAAGAIAAYLLRGGKTSPRASAQSPAVKDATTAFQAVNAINSPVTTVPAGWTSKTVTASDAGSSAGFSIALPAGWTEQRKNLATYFSGPGGLLLDIDLTTHAHPNMVTEARQIERYALRTDRFAHYQRLHLEAVPVRGTNGAFWQFTWQPADSPARLADDILFIKPTPAGSQSYAVYIRGERKKWDSTELPIFDEILSTFKTVPAS